MDRSIHASQLRTISSILELQRRIISQNVQTFRPQSLPLQQSDHPNWPLNVAFLLEMSSNAAVYYPAPTTNPHRRIIDDGSASPTVDCSMKRRPCIRESRAVQRRSNTALRLCTRLTILRLYHEQTCVRSKRTDVSKRQYLSMPCTEARYSARWKNRRARHASIENRRLPGRAMLAGW